MDTAALTVPAIAGAVAPFVLALINRKGWGPDVKRAVSLGFYVVVTAGIVLSNQFPHAWETIAAQLATVIAAGQVAFSALKPSGILDQIEESTSPTPTVFD